MGRRALSAFVALTLLAFVAGTADARGGGGVGGGGGGGRRRATKGQKGASQAAAILDAAVRRDNVRRSRLVDW